MKQSIWEIFEIGKKYTIFTISGGAMTYKKEVVITQYVKAAENGEQDSAPMNPVYKLKGKRSEYVLKLRMRSYASAPLEEFEGAVFEGWNQPVTCDTDGGRVFRGNACYNFVAAPETIREWIDAYQINPNFDKSKVVAVSVENHEAEFVVYPELFRHDHAVISRILEKQQ